MDCENFARKEEPDKGRLSAFHAKIRQDNVPLDEQQKQSRTILN